MTPVLCMTRRVQFAETDLAGVAHFSNYFRWMEELEHAFWRSIGLSVHRGNEGIAEGWPRVAASCEYHSPVRFEDEVEMSMSVTALGEKSMSYETEFQRLGRRVASGRMTVVYCALESGVLQAVAIPEAIRAKLAPLVQPATSRTGSRGPKQIERSGSLP